MVDAEQWTLLGKVCCTHVGEGAQLCRHCCRTHFAIALVFVTTQVRMHAGRLGAIVSSPVGRASQLVSSDRVLRWLKVWQYLVLNVWEQGVRSRKPRFCLGRWETQHSKFHTPDVSKNCCVSVQKIEVRLRSASAKGYPLYNHHGAGRSESESTVVTSMLLYGSDGTGSRAIGKVYASSERCVFTLNVIFVGGRLGTCIFACQLVFGSRPLAPQRSR